MQLAKKASLSLCSPCSAWVLCIAMLMAAPGVHALGFGRSASSATLGQPLNFTVALRQDTDEYVDAECVSAEVHVGDNKVQPQRVRVVIEGGAGSAERVLRVTSTALIDEPIVSVSVAVGCPPRLSRNFVLLADPPVIQLAEQSPAIEAPRQETAEAAPVPPSAPLITTVPPRPRSEAESAARPRPAARRPARAAAAAAPRAGVTVPVAPRAASAPGSVVTARLGEAPVQSGDRLRLDTAQAAARDSAAAKTARERASPATAAMPAPPAAPSASASAGLAVSEAASAPALAASMPTEAASMPASVENERLRLLEESLAKLRNDSRSTADELNTLRARLQRAESDRYANSLVYLLIAACAALAAVVGWLMLRRSREREANWWIGTQQAAEKAVAAPPPVSQFAASESHADSTLDSSYDSMPGAVLEELAPRRGPLTLSPETQPAVNEQRREVSVEELIDLEQQAEFFVVLGQDESAIDLLMNHLRNTGGISPLPYLKLLEIYRRRDDRDAYDRMRERFNRRFNAYAPEWDTDLSKGRSLEDYPQVMRRISNLWSTPKRAMDALESMLFRQDSGETFEVPAYSEVLFLYSMARDLSDHEDARGGDVDLLLPMDDDTIPRGAAGRVTMSTIAMESNPNVEKPLSLDLDITGDKPGDGAKKR